MAEGSCTLSTSLLPTNNRSPKTEDLADLTDLKYEVTNLLYQQEQRLQSIFRTQQQQLEQRLTLLRQAIYQTIEHVQNIQRSYHSQVLNTHNFQQQTPSPSLCQNQLDPFQNTHTPEPYSPSPEPELIEIDFPHFAEGDPTSWIFKVESIFKYYQIPPQDHLLLASFHLDAPAIRWYQCFIKDNLQLDWPTFVDGLHKRFGPLDFAAFDSKIIKDLQLNKTLLQRSHRPNLTQRPNMPPPHNPPVPSQSSKSPTRDSSPSGKPTPSYFEIVDDQNEIDEAQPLSQRSPKLLRFWGFIYGQPVQVLISTGCTHNVISDKLVQFFQLPTSTIKSNFVQIGLGEGLQCDKICYNTAIDIHGNDFLIDLFVAQLHDLDIVLGVQWLKTLGRTTFDFSSRSMSFQWNGKKIKLKVPLRYIFCSK